MYIGNSITEKDFKTAVDVGRPPNIVKLFPNSQALLVSGKYMDLALSAKGRAMTIAANCRSHLIIKGVLLAAQRANAAVIVEIARGESSYCAVNYWNIARQVDALCNEMGITVPVAIHADHYTIKSRKDIAAAERQIPTLFEAGITSIAIDASHLPDDLNLLANIALNPYVPEWAGLETEVGEIKGKLGLSTPEEAGFLVAGLNAHNIFPTWIALNNGTVHGIESNGDGIQVDLTASIHEALSAYNVSGAQHGTSGNSRNRLKKIAALTRTTKANVATALQMVSWGLKVDADGNAVCDDNGSFIKAHGQGVEEALWQEMKTYAETNGLVGGNYKFLNMPFETKIMSQPQAIRDRIAKRVEAFVYFLLTEVFNAKDTAPLVIDAILDIHGPDPGAKATRIEKPSNWTPQQIAEKAALIESDKGPAGDYDD
jgi:fructose/tagatose bisphosphate aldolase